MRMWVYSLDEHLLAKTCIGQMLLILLLFVSFRIPFFQISATFSSLIVATFLFRAVVKFTKVKMIPTKTFLSEWRQRMMMVMMMMAMIMMAMIKMTMLYLQTTCVAWMSTMFIPLQMIKACKCKITSMTKTILMKGLDI